MLGCALNPTELPPRTRRIPFQLPVVVAHVGTTSAYAENTECLIRTEDGNRNYLRVRGEYPPRGQNDQSAKGTTSAYAENTWASEYLREQYGNYLRVRGEYTATASTTKK